MPKNVRTPDKDLCAVQNKSSFRHNMALRPKNLKLDEHRGATVSSSVLKIILAIQNADQRNTL
jgi:hypothetical protein